MDDPILTVWKTHCRLQSSCIQALPPESLESRILPKGRTAGQILAHIYNNRINWLEPASPDLCKGLGKIKPELSADKTLLLESLRKSNEAVLQLLQRSLEAGGKVKGFRGHAASFMGYLIAHESYHLGQLVQILKVTGSPLDKETAYALWDWRDQK